MIVQPSAAEVNHNISNFYTARAARYGPPEDLRRAIDCGYSPIPLCGVVRVHTAAGAVTTCTCPRHNKNGQTCKTPGKIPLLKWGGIHRRPTWNDCCAWEDEYRSRGVDAINWAFQFNLSGKIGIDVDFGPGHKDDGIAEWAKLVARYGKPPVTPIDSVQGRGFRMWLQEPEAGVLPESTHFYLAPGVEIKYGRNYFVGPPSIHKSGKPYLWEVAPWEKAAAPPFQWLIDLMHEVKAKETPKLIAPPAVSLPAYQWPKTADDMAHVLKRARHYVQTIPGAIQGRKGSNPAFHVACVLVLGFDLSISDALPIMRDWNWTCSPPWSESELLHKLDDANKKTVQRGYLLNANGWAAGLEAAEFAKVLAKEKSGAITITEDAGDFTPRLSALSTWPATTATGQLTLDAEQAALLRADLAQERIERPETGHPDSWKQQQLSDEELYDAIDAARWSRSFCTCTCGTIIGLENLEDGTPIERVKRGGRCPGCQGFKTWRGVKVLSNHMRRAVDAGRGLFIVATSAKQWEHDRKQLDYYSPDDEIDGYCRFADFAISTAPVGSPITFEDAVERIKDALDSTIRRPGVADYSTSETWELPKKPDRPPQCRFRTYLDPASEETKQQIAYNCDAEIRTKVQPDGELGDTIKQQTYVRRHGWTKADREYFWAQRKMGDAFPRGDMREHLYECDSPDERIDADARDGAPIEVDLQLTC